MRELGTVATTLEQANSDQSLKFSNRFRDCGLSDCKIISGALHVAEMGDSQETLHVAKLDATTGIRPIHNCLSFPDSQNVIFHNFATPIQFFR
jgi:hypothetical protein